jgi:multidrug efflux pump subunit AcrA (membrane-fusion protein)
LLKPGSFARATLRIVTKPNGVIVPQAAIQRQKSETIVFLDAGDGVYKRREVKLGSRSGDWVEILEGLEAGQTVVTQGSFILKSELEKSGFADKD